MMVFNFTIRSGERNHTLLCVVGLALLTQSVGFVREQRSIESHLSWHQRVPEGTQHEGGGGEPSLAGERAQQLCL
jgi:hypothetical protein